MQETGVQEKCRKLSYVRQDGIQGKTNTKVFLAAVKGEKILSSIYLLTFSLHLIDLLIFSCFEYFLVSGLPIMLGGITATHIIANGVC